MRVVGEYSDESYCKFSGESVGKFCSVLCTMLIEAQFHTFSNISVLLQIYVPPFSCSSFLSKRLVSMWSLSHIKTSSFKV